jgi:hypothetical protein
MSETTPQTAESPLQKALARKIPTIAELVRASGNVGESHKKDSLNELLNQPPHASWVKSHPMAKVKNDQGQDVPAKYLPIDKVEFLLTYIFQNWRIEVLREQVMFNAITVTIRLHVQNPITLEWTYNDGVGAMNVQTNKDKSAADLAEIKSAAVQMAIPSAKSYAIKDAAEHFGAIFGRDLNRRDIIQFSGAHTKESPAAASPAPSYTSPAPTAAVPIAHLPATSKALSPSAEYDVSYVAESPAKAVSQTPYPSGTTAKSNSDTLFSNL